MQSIQSGPYVATQLFSGVWAIDQDFVRCFLVLGTKCALLIDSCAVNSDLAGLVSNLTTLPVKLVQTHCDQDHIGASTQFTEVYMHPAEFALLRETSELPLMPRAVREGERLDLGERALEVLLLPGHTPGSIALLDHERRILYSGDSVKGDIIYMFGPGRDLDAYADSLERLYAIRDRYDTILPCHGPMPIASDVIPNLIEGAKLLRAGKLSCEDDGGGMPCKLYTYKTARFYF